MNASELTTISAEELKPVHLPGAIIPAPPEDSDTSIMRIEIGPAHPAMHGIVRLTTYLDGEQIVGMVPEIGYLHRGFEKESENSKWIQVIPYTDRLNYVSPVLNNIGYSMAVEKLFGVEIPRRAQFARVIMGEISRITDHLTCLAACAMESADSPSSYGSSRHENISTNYWNRSLAGELPSTGLASVATAPTSQMAF